MQKCPVLLDALSFPHGVYEDEEGVTVYVWPAAAAPGMDWESVGDE